MIVCPSSFILHPLSFISKEKPHFYHSYSLLMYTGREFFLPKLYKN